jgi:hypothetical protein
VREAIPWLPALILTHIFFGSLVERIGIARVVKPSSMLIGLRTRFTEAIWKMWVRIRLPAMGRMSRRMGSDSLLEVPYQ